MFDVITIGSSSRDVFLVSDAFKAIQSKKFKTGIGECVSLGSKVDVKKIVFTTGGGGTNTAATFASLDYKTGAILKIGNDAAGRDILDDLKNFKISQELVKISKTGQTSYSTALTMKDGERTILVYRGVSSNFQQKDIPFTKLKSKWLYVTSLGGDLKLLKKIVSCSSAHGTFIAWNPGSKELEKGIKTFRSILPHVNILIINKEEAGILTKEKTGSIQKLVDAIALEKDQVLIITNGPQGTYASYDNVIGHCGTTGAKSISSTGAGDAFGSGFIAGIMKTNDLETALKIGTINAESVIQSYGAKNGILTNWPSAQKLERIKISIL